MFDDSYTAPSWTKKALTGALLIMFFMSSFIGVFFPQIDPTLERNLDSLNSDYARMTGGSATEEEIWALTGIYTPVGIDADGNPASGWGYTRDGWIYGDRVINYTPVNYNDLNGGKEGYTVRYDEGTGLYYYTAAGSDLRSIKVDPDNLTESTLYTSVTMDWAPEHKSNVFFTTGGKVEQNGRFYYNFSGYRYCMQPLRDYQASSNLNVDKTTSSLSLIYYSYYTDEGISGQLILSGADAGISYLSAGEIIRAFDSTIYTSKFQLVFNGLDINLYIQINPWAIQHMSVEQCFNQGYWSFMVTSPAVTDSTSGFTLDALSIDNIFGAIWNLLTFNTEVYGLTGTAKTIAVLFFNMSLYTTLLSLALMNLKTMLIAGLMGGIIAAVQAISWITG